MAKINATYSSGYYLAPDTDYRKLEDAQDRERKRRRQDPEADGIKNSVIRQTFAIPFNIICLHCNHRIARGTHGYVNRRPTDEKYMGIRVWELEFRCIFCKGHIYLTTDYETAKLTGGYHCSRNCKRGQGDFYGTNQINESVRAKQSEADAEKGTMDALERENEAMRQLQERDRHIEELVEAKAAVEETQVRDELLEAIRTRRGEGPRAVETETDADADAEADAEAEADEVEYRRFEVMLHRWRAETEAQSSQPENIGEVAATLASKYNESKNVFCAGDSDDEADGSAEKNVGQDQARTHPLGSASASGTKQSKQSKQSSTCAGPPRRNGSALASLLED